MTGQEIGAHPLSRNQEFLCLFDQGNDTGPFGPRYNITLGCRISGPLDLDALQGALDDVVERHEALRTVIVRGEHGSHQRIEPPGPVRMVVSRLAEDGARTRARRAEEFVVEVDSATHSSQDLPHLRAFLGRFDDTEAVLVLVVHHTATDGWSMQVVMRDVATLYARRRSHDVPAPAPVPRYTDFAARQAEQLAGDEAEDAREFWRDRLDGARMITLPTDHARSAGRPKLTSIHRFLIPPDLSRAVLELSTGLRSSPFMVFLAAYGLALSKLTGETDMTIPVITSGRRDEEFDGTVGPLFNFVPYRTDLGSCLDFRDVVDRMRTTCIETFSAELPFLEIAAVAPELMAPMAGDRAAAVAIQVVQFPTTLDGELVGDLEFREIRRRLLSQEVGEDIPDGALLTLDVDPSGDIVGRLGFNNNLYDEATMVDLVAEFQRVLRDAVAAPGAPL